MDLIKYNAIEAIKKLPDGCSAEDIMYQIYFVSQVLEGLRDADEGRVLSTEDVLEQIEKW
jgi:predicted transcriptional regulator